MGAAWTLVGFLSCVRPPVLLQGIGPPELLATDRTSEAGRLLTGNLGITELLLASLEDSAPPVVTP